MSIRFYTFLFWACLFFFAKEGFGQSASSLQQTITITKGSSAVLRANSAGASSYIWYKDGILINNQNKQTLITATAGVYKVVSINSLGCSSDLSDEMVVVIRDIVAADLSITKRSVSKNVVVAEVFDYHLNVRNNGVNDATGVLIKDKLPDNLEFSGLEKPTEGTASYDADTRTVSWKIDLLPNGSFSELIVKAMARKPGFISNTATVSGNEHDPYLANNTSTDNKEISGLRIPNVFTPNGDGKNETFYLENLSAFEFNEVTIINRWGSTIYQANGYMNDWTAPGISDGTYFYVVKVRNGSADWIEYKGYVTIIR